MGSHDGEGGTHRPAGPAGRRPGEVLVRREVWRGRPWMGTAVRVVEDRDDLLAVYLPEGASFAFPDGPWPGGRHPWHGRGIWEGHGVLMLQRPRDAYAVWVFWEGPERRLVCWYVNLQAPPRRTALGFDTLDHELDVVVLPDGSRSLKDEDLLAERVSEGRFTEREARRIRDEGARICTMLDRGERWWDDRWAEWRPPPGFGAAPLPEGWDAAAERIVAGRVSLRPLTADDLAWYERLGGIGVDAATAELTAAARHRARHGFSHFAVERADTGLEIGVVELHFAGDGVDGIEPDEVEIGWVVDEAHRGRGYASEAALAVVRHAFDDLGLDALVAYVRPANAASLRVAARLGMSERGRGRTRSGDDCIVFELEPSSG